MGGISCLILSIFTVKLAVYLRTLFLVTFLLVAFDVITYSWFIVLNLVIFSVTNGYGSTLCCVKAPQTVEGEAKAQVGGFIGITISTGIMLGSVLAFTLYPVVKVSPEY